MTTRGTEMTQETPREADLRSEATPRPWVAQSPSDGAERDWYIDTHAYADGPEPVWAPSYPVTEEDVSLIVTAVNDYDRLLRVEEAARAAFDLHRPASHVDYVAIPPQTVTVCLSCEVGDGYHLWPCPTATALREALGETER